MSRQPMSMEAMLDEERREVLALLEGTKARAPSSLGARSPSPYASPRSPMRSMLDVGEDSPPPSRLSSSPEHNKKSPPRNLPVRSMLDVDNGPVRSMLDVGGSPPPPAMKQVFSNPTSPIETNHRAHAANSSHHPRSLSDASSKPVEFGPRSSSSKVDPTTAGYQFSDIFTANSGAALPKRVSQGGKRNSGAMAQVIRGNDLILPGDRGRHHSVAGPSARGSTKSRSPALRGVRSNSPANLLLGRQLSPAGRAIIEESLDLSNAYRRLSDANLARSQGSLAELGRRKRSDEVSSGRMIKDYLSPDGDLLEESSDEHEGSSSEDEERGRKAARSFEGPGSGKLPAGQGLDKNARKTLSLLAAAEEERMQVASQQPAYHYRSLLDEPEITITGPSGEKMQKPSKTGVHPATSFDEPPPSGYRTPMDSDTEADLTDIKRAQKLSFSMTPIMSTPEAHRALRIIYRGEYAKIVQDAEEEHRRLRKYLVATDLSDESTHALEWAIGTVLRDGDTLIAIYCVDEETGIVTGENALVPDDPRAMKEQANAINAMTASRAPVSPGGNIMPLQHRASPLMHAVDNPSISPASRERNKAEEERHRAVQDITDRVTKLLRKTRLQVRVIVEVLHCKNPKHLITEVIDIVSPTLVILGSRGRSALKGVILGSFSNYLVTKSSVPVMVARKRLRKQSKYKRPLVQQVNNLSSPAARSLANAKID